MALAVYFSALLVYLAFQTVYFAPLLACRNARLTLVFERFQLSSQGVDILTKPGDLLFVLVQVMTVALPESLTRRIVEGFFVDRTEQNLKPRFLKGGPPSDLDIADVIQKISRRIIRKLHQLGYLEASIDIPLATGYDPLLDNEPELARTMAASVNRAEGAAHRLRLWR